MNTRQCTKPSGVLEGVPKALFWKQLEVQLERSVHMHAHTHTHTQLYGDLSLWICHSVSLKEHLFHLNKCHLCKCNCFIALVHLMFFENHKSCLWCS